MRDNHVAENEPIAGERNNKCVMMHNKIQKQASHLLFLKSLKLKTNVTCNLFTPLFMFIHLPLIHFAPNPRLLINF